VKEFCTNKIFGWPIYSFLCEKNAYLVLNFWNKKYEKFKEKVWFFHNFIFFLIFIFFYFIICLFSILFFRIFLIVQKDILTPWKKDKFWNKKNENSKKENSEKIKLWEKFGKTEVKCETLLTSSGFKVFAANLILSQKMVFELDPQSNPDRTVIRPYLGGKLYLTLRVLTLRFLRNFRQLTTKNTTILGN